MSSSCTRAPVGADLGCAPAGEVTTTNMKTHYVSWVTGEVTTTNMETHYVSWVTFKSGITYRTYL
jgi:desulfoferrodoxin (superoxide reductase-like protein)